MEKRDPNFDEKIAQVHSVYEQVQFMQDEKEYAFCTVTTISYDEKPEMIQTRRQIYHQSPGGMRPLNETMNMYVMAR